MTNEEISKKAAEKLTAFMDSMEQEFDNKLILVSILNRNQAVEILSQLITDKNADVLPLRLGIAIEVEKDKS